MKQLNSIFASKKKAINMRKFKYKNFVIKQGAYLRWTVGWPNEIVKVIGADEDGIICKVLKPEDYHPDIKNDPQTLPGNLYWLGAENLEERLKNGAIEILPLLKAKLLLLFYE